MKKDYLTGTNQFTHRHELSVAALRIFLTLSRQLLTSWMVVMINTERNSMVNSFQKVINYLRDENLTFNDLTLKKEDILNNTSAA